MKIILDNRENSLYEKCVTLLNNTKSQEVILSKEVLLLGDISIQTNDGKDIVLIERKSIQDLLASIKDGRYEEQSHRLIHSSGIHRHNIQYIIEGGLSFLNPAEKKLVFSAMTSLSVFKGFSVLRTASLQETADYIISMSDKINRELNKGRSLHFSNVKCEENAENGENSENHNEASENIKGYSEFVKKVKRDNITPENIGEILLCQIPGISSVSAQAIMKKFGGSFYTLIQEIQTNKDSFKNIVYEKDGKSRKINRTCGENIFKYLCKTQVEETSNIV